MIEEAFGGENPKGYIDDKMDAMKKAKICAEFKDDTLFYTAEDGKQGLITGNNVERQAVVIDKLVQFFIDHPERIPDETVKTTIKQLNSREDMSKRIPYDDQDEEILQGGVEVESYVPRPGDNVYMQVRNYVSSWTNEQCEQLYQQLVQERIQQGEGHGIVPVTKADIDARMAKAVEKSKSKGAEGAIEKSKRVYSYLPKGIRERIEANRARHERENEADQALYEEMERADQDRQQGKSAPEDTPVVLGELVGDSTHIVSGGDMGTVANDLIGDKDKTQDTERESDEEQK